ncbi:HpcH/HpaI aldolase family protein [Agromyces subbeticus]|uniref:HpcH/HpaI aldolase family protein n=1 Tax=Agromyces subbeticus TaxID=293890 RepID=UPI0003B60C2F|nr:aldolase/citrate lyase family protein [Agromyces subbeticus]
MTTSANPIVRQAASGQIPLGMQCFTGDPALVEVLGLTGFDFVMLDSEHCGIDPRGVEPLIRAADGVGLTSFVRVPTFDDEVSIHRALEAGAAGVFVPMVRNAADVQVALDAAYFPPLGQRGICPATRQARYSFRDFVETAERNNATNIVIPLIEHPDAVENIDEICAMPDVHMVTFGQGDYAYAIGEGTLMMKSPKVQAAQRRVVEAAKRHGVLVIGGPVLEPSVDACRAAIDAGVDVFCLGLDIMAFRRVAEQTVNLVHEAVQGTEFSRAEPPMSGFPGH